MPDYRHVLAFACPTCGVRAGEPCRAKHGRPTHLANVHAGRVRQLRTGAMPDLSQIHRPLRCPGRGGDHPCGSTDVIYSERRGNHAALVSCCTCGRLWVTRSRWARVLPTWDQRQSGQAKLVESYRAHQRMLDGMSDA